MIAIEWDIETQAIVSKYLQLRHQLIPYLYSEFLKATLNNEMMFRPLSFDFENDSEAANVEDQLLLGNELMIAPVYKQNATGRYVYLPEEMMLIRMRSYDEIGKEILVKGHHYIKVGLEELVFFVRKGKAIPFFEPKRNTIDLLNGDSFELGYANYDYEFYKDDGISTIK